MGPEALQGGVDMADGGRFGYEAVNAILDELGVARDIGGQCRSSEHQRFHKGEWHPLIARGLDDQMMIAPDIRHAFDVIAKMHTSGKVEHFREPLHTSAVFTLAKKGKMQGAILPTRMGEGLKKKIVALGPRLHACNAGHPKRALRVRPAERRAAWHFDGVARDTCAREAGADMKLELLNVSLGDPVCVGRTGEGGAKAVGDIVGRPFGGIQTVGNDLERHAHLDGDFHEGKRRYVVSFGEDNRVRP